MEQIDLHLLARGLEELGYGVKASPHAQFDAKLELTRLSKDMHKFDAKTKLMRLRNKIDFFIEVF